jgi:hypothetical protein
VAIGTHAYWLARVALSLRRGPRGERRP